MAVQRIVGDHCAECEGWFGNVTVLAVPVPSSCGPLLSPESNRPGMQGSSRWTFDPIWSRRCVGGPTDSSRLPDPVIGIWSVLAVEMADVTRDHLGIHHLLPVAVPVPGLVPMPATGTGQPGRVGLRADANMDGSSAG